MIAGFTALILGIQSESHFVWWLAYISFYISKWNEKFGDF